MADDGLRKDVNQGLARPVVRYDGPAAVETEGADMAHCDAAGVNGSNRISLMALRSRGRRRMDVWKFRARLALVLTETSSWNRGALESVTAVRQFV